jgi:hypothetical protein
MKKANYLFTIAFGLTILLSINYKLSAQMSTKYTIQDTVSLSGIVTQSTFLSTSDGSEKEYFNDAYNLELNEKITISNVPNITDTEEKYFVDITHIEIQEPHLLEMRNYSGKRVSIKGILKTFNYQIGYYRQYSTPVQIEIIKIELQKDDCSEALRNALSDIEKGNYSLYIFGQKRYDGSFSTFFQKFLAEKYKIKLIIYGCEIDKYVQCYAEIMNTEFEKKIGLNYLEKFETEAKEKYNK